MTRSQMIKHIKEELREIVNIHYNYYDNSDRSDWHFYQRKAEDILDMIQGFGMLPPTITKDNKQINEWDEE